MRKIYGVLSDRQKEAIRESQKFQKIIKKENPQRFGADYNSNN